MWIRNKEVIIVFKVAVQEKEVQDAKGLQGARGSGKYKNFKISLVSGGH